ncbi:MAG TPA: vWA domain-containing protein [Polyangiaceae bacterium]|nr:vWA domain-containing protein [Polyangiaceae bacterium]
MVWELVACSAKTGAAPNPGPTAGGSGSAGAPSTVMGSGATTGAAGFSTSTGSTTGIGGGFDPGIPRPKDMGAGPDGSCGELPFSAEQQTKTTTVTTDVPQPIDLYIMWDQSLSMTCAVPAPGGGTGGMAGMGGMAGAAPADRWDAVKTPLSTWVQSVPAMPPFNVGIGYFGDSLFASCDPMTYAKPDVEIGPLPTNAAPIVSSLNAHMPSTNTPTPPALTGAVNHALSWKMSHPNDVVAVILVTDGQPNACGAVADVATAAAMGWNGGMGIRTFVIGVTSPGTTCNIDPNPPNVPDLDTVAAAGGTNKALIVDVTQDPAKQLTDELNMIRQTITQTMTMTKIITTKLSCEYKLPSDPNAMAGTGVVFDKDKVNVNFTSNMGVKEQVYRVDSLDKCSSTNSKGWYYDNNDKPTQILMCPSACKSIQVPDGGLDPTAAGSAPQVNVTLGCKSLYAPPA